MPPSSVDLPPTQTSFPLAVWLQSPKNAPKFKALGINTYVGLWKGPTEEQLVELRKRGMKVICSQNAVGLRHLYDPTIIGWMHGDEPDNAQGIGHWKSTAAIQQAWPGAPNRTLKQWGRGVRCRSGKGGSRTNSSRTRCISTACSPLASLDINAAPARAFA